MTARIDALAKDSRHRFAKQPCAALRLIAGIGVEGDAHAGAMVQHLSRIRQNPTAPNLRQVHLIHGELLDELRARGFSVEPAHLGENITTRGIDLLGLSQGTQLRLGNEAVIEITGLRNPCRQIDENVGPGAMKAVLDRASDGELVRKAGIMAVVIEGGEIRVGDAISIEWEPAGHVPLSPV